MTDSPNNRIDLLAQWRDQHHHRADETTGGRITVRNAVKIFGKERALDGVDLDVEPGTVTALLGPNGAGKTTLVRLLTTLLQPDGGELTVGGFDVTRSPEEVRRILGLTGQYAAVDENLTGRENLELVGRLHHLGRHEARSRAGELLDRFSLTDAADRQLKTYSGGMRRKIDLAASLVGKPRILFLDEPTTGLDPRSRIELWRVINDLVTDGTTLLLTTQYLEEADRLADSITVIDHGRVIAAGTARELKARIGGTEVIEMHLADHARLGDATEALGDLGDGRTQADEASGRITIVVDRAASALPEAIRRLDRRGIALQDVFLRQPTLDDVFLALTGRDAGEPLNTPV